MTTSVSTAQAMLDKHGEKRQAIFDSLDSTINRINQQRSLSDAARTSRIAVAWQSAQTQLHELQATTEAALNSHGRRLVDRAFGSKGGDPQTVMAQRQANQMVAGLNDSRLAMEQLRGAQHDGDTQMAKTIARHAYSNGWTEVVDQWNHDGSHDPEIRMLNEHRELPHVQSSIVWQQSHYMPPPRALSGMNPMEINRAAQADYSDGGDAA